MSITGFAPFYLMNNVIQNYAWGSVDSIQQLFGIDNPTHQPQAEIWMGAHPGGCSQITVNGQQQLLADVINQDRSTLLSAATADQFGELPYLFKVLAAAKALSIQVHPSKAEAEIGFTRENEAQIPFHAANRNYKDPNHKPELVYALTTYQALNGFRPLEEIAQRIKATKIASVIALLGDLDAEFDSAKLQTFFIELLSLTGDKQAQAVEQLIQYATQNRSDKTLALILELAQQYPGDIGLFSPLMLNYITLQPGEAMFLDARTPHAYLKGTGLEVMANSDNVLRAGLTPKHIDIPEIASCTLFAEKPAATLLLKPQEKQGVLHFPVPVADFKFSLYPTSIETKVEVTSAEIIFAIDDVTTLHHANGVQLSIKKGQSVFIPANAVGYSITSSGRVARVYN
jgi:mannose-6-phosphate isomerase